MSGASPSAVDHATDIAYRVILSSGKISKPIDISVMVTDIDIFEHIEKPYLTGVVGFLDSTDVLGSTDFGGGEKLEITLSSDQIDGATIVKTFYIDTIMSSVKGNDSNEYIIFHIIEDIGYESNLRNVNKSYTGKASKILASICSEYFEKKKCLSTANDSHEMKVIVPNLTPLDAMCWIKNKTTTEDGYPFYLFSALQVKDLVFMDLESLMKAAPSNRNAPFTYAQADVGDVDIDHSQKRRTILSYSYSKTENLFNLIAAGHIGARHQFFDVTENYMTPIKFDVTKDVIGKLESSNIVKDKPLYSNEYRLRGISFNDIESRVTSQIGGTSAYENHKTFSERDTEGMYRLDVAGRSMSALIKKSPLSFVVNGIDFFKEGSHNTLGRKLRLRFLSNSENEDNPFDTQKSGDYLIFSAKHSIKKEGYHISLTGVKLDNGEV
jgi:hypothetical protein